MVDFSLYGPLVVWQLVICFLVVCHWTPQCVSITFVVIFENVKVLSSVVNDDVVCVQHTLTARFILILGVFPGNFGVAWYMHP